MPHPTLYISYAQYSGDGMLRHLPNYGTQRLPNDDDDDEYRGPE